MALNPAIVAFTSIIHNDTYPAIDTTKVEPKGRYVFIVGASKGIGREMALSFAKAGAAGIAIGARSDLSSVATDVEETAKKAGREVPRVLPLHLDVTDEESVRSAASQITEKFGQLDILINNAGVVESPFRPLADSKSEDWWHVLTVNIRGPYLVTRAFLPLMLTRGEKTIINVTSIAAHWIYPGASAYGVSKLGIVRLTEFIDKEYSSEGILAYTVHPGQILTNLGSRMPEEAHSMMTDTETLPADTMVYLTQNRQEWLAGRYISCAWDMPELFARKDEIVQDNKLKIEINV